MRIMRTGGGLSQLRHWSELIRTEPPVKLACPYIVHLESEQGLSCRGCMHGYSNHASRCKFKTTAAQTGVYPVFDALNWASSDQKWASMASRRKYGSFRWSVERTQHRVFLAKNWWDVGGGWRMLMETWGSAARSSVRGGDKSTVTISIVCTVCGHIGQWINDNKSIEHSMHLNERLLGREATRQVFNGRVCY